jgi:hypothetical protein
MVAKRLKKGVLKSQNRLYKGKNVYFSNLSVAQAFELFDSASYEFSKEIFENFVLCLIGLFIMVQISISAKPESGEWVERLPSYKDIKSRIINGKPGSVLSACFGITLAFPYALDDLEGEGIKMYDDLAVLVQQLIESQGANVKRIKPSKAEWLSFARGEMGSVRGQLLSCPSTNIARLNIDGSDVSSYNIQNVLENSGLDESMFPKYDLSIDIIVVKFRKLFLIDKGGLPIENLIYDEPGNISSRIQNEIFGGNIIRSENVGTKLVKGVEPASPINRSILSENLTKNELFAYDIAIRSGDVAMVKKLTNTAISRTKKS